MLYIRIVFTKNNKESIKIMMDWDKLRIFYVVATAGSFTSAASIINISQSALSRQILSLEHSIKTQLFHRHARGLVLTEQGEILFKYAKDIYNKMEKAQESLTQNKERPSGMLRINVPVALGTLYLAPIMEQFKSQYPDIEVHIICSDKQLDLSHLEADLAIFQHPSTHLGLIQKKISRQRVLAYASEEYLQRKGIPKVASDLDYHNLIVYERSANMDNDYNSDWLLSVGCAKGHERRPYMTINNVHGMYRMARSGAGVVALPEFTEDLPGDLKKVLSTEQGPEFDIYVVYPQEYKEVQKVQVFKDFLVEKSVKNL